MTFPVFYNRINVARHVLLSSKYLLQYNVTLVRLGVINSDYLAILLGETVTLVTLVRAERGARP